MRIPNVTRAMVNLTRARLRHAERHWRAVVRIAERAGKHARRQAAIVGDAPALLRARARQGRTAIVRTRKRYERFDVHVVTPYRTAARVTSSRAPPARRAR